MELLEPLHTDTHLGFSSFRTAASLLQPICCMFFYFIPIGHAQAHPRCAPRSVVALGRRPPFTSPATGARLPPRPRLGSAGSTRCLSLCQPPALRPTVLWSG
eukprot:4777747-Pleurochrysis_carterae.AAC.1